MTIPSLPDLICFSHLRWRFVFQRPQHLMRRFAQERRVFFWEEPVEEGTEPRLHLELTPESVCIATPTCPGDDRGGRIEAQEQLLFELAETHAIERRIAWYYTPMALQFSRRLLAETVVYDCMDELSAFRGAPPALLSLESELLRRSHLVFTGGASLYEAKRHRHADCHAFPSSVDVAHFGQACRMETGARSAEPVLGFAGVVDERMDLALLAEMARQRPGWRIEVVGPVVKIDPAQLPQAHNLIYLGQQPYSALPELMAKWDVALIPFALNEATRFISPTKTPEYLAAGRPVVSTRIADVVQPYGHLGLVRIADDPAGFIQAVEASLRMDRESWLRQVDAHLASLSWDRTWQQMRQHLVSRAHPMPSASGVAHSSR